jgi:tRNA(Ile)-lysidine synthase
LWDNGLSCPPHSLLYHVGVHELAQRLLTHIRREDLMHAGDRVGVAVSGGIDSVALLRLLLELRHELGIVVSVVHFNHKLRGAESDVDQEFVAILAREHGLEFHTDSGDVAKHAADEHGGVEAAARELRYSYFRYLLGEDSAEGDPQSSPRVIDKLATGHNLDDQAETVLMRVIRGTGLRGLGAIHPRIPVEDLAHEMAGEIVRPLLALRRRELEQYLKELNQPWREDSTNPDAGFTRNRMRQRVLPLLEQEFNPSVAENLAELAEIARGEQDYWENEISGWLGTTVQWSEPQWARGRASGSGESSLVQITPPKSDLERRLEESGPLVMNASVSRPWFLTEPVAVQRRLVKAIGDHAGVPFEFKHVEQILRFAAQDGASGKELSLPLGWKLVREPDTLIFLTPDLRRQERIPPDYEYALPVPGQATVPETGTVIEAVRLRCEAQTAGYNRDQLLDADLLSDSLRVRNWRPGDRFWPAHTKSARKIKELLLDRHVAGNDRRLWPVVVSGEDIVWVRGFPSPSSLRAKPHSEAVLIRETSTEADDGSSH